MKIGISCRENIVNEKESYVLYKRYIKSLEGEVVLILPDQSEEILDLCDKFIITGGDDLNSNLYNEENINSKGVNDKMDELDFMIIKHCVKKNKPLLGICRGIQSINVFFNGTLIQDIDKHMEVNHIIRRKSGGIDFGDELFVNSYHHQAIGKIGDGLIPCYISDDAVIEIMIHNKFKIIAVQFHPEINNDNVSSKIYNYFLKM